MPREERIFAPPVAADASAVAPDASRRVHFASQVSRGASAPAPERQSTETRSMPSAPYRRQEERDFAPPRHRSGGTDSTTPNVQVAGSANVQEGGRKCQCGWLVSAGNAFCGHCGRLQRSLSVPTPLPGVTTSSSSGMFSSGSPSRRLSTGAETVEHFDISSVEEMPEAMLMDIEHTSEVEHRGERSRRHKAPGGGGGEDPDDSSPWSSGSESDPGLPYDDQGGRDPTYQDMFGPVNKDPGGGDTSWTVGEESSVYKDKELDRIELPDLPSDAATKRGWDASVTTRTGAIDRSVDDMLVRWLVPA